MQYYLSDIFPQAHAFQVLVVPRENFIPLKNPAGKPIASPEWVIQQVTRQDFMKLLRAGAHLDLTTCAQLLRHRLPPEVWTDRASDWTLENMAEQGEGWAGLVEISPRVSSQGENLEVFNGVRVKLPCIVFSQDEREIHWKDSTLWEQIAPCLYLLKEKDGDYYQYVVRADPSTV